MANKPMSADDLADKAVEVFNAMASPRFAFQAENPEGLPEIERETTDLVVYCYGFAESEERVTRGFAERQEREVAVLVSRPFAIDEQIQRRELVAFVNDLKREIKGQTFDGFGWIGNETVTLFDVQTIRERKHFMSLFRSTFFGMRY